ncbi:MAG: 30S ribosomal protein S6 [Gemmataceae bacterium]|jgi:small subunit ribosomal protein S6
MSEKIYEGMFLLDTGKMTGDMNVTADQLIGLIQKHGGEVYTHRVWDDRKLAYAVKKQKKAVYFMMHFKLNGPTIATLGKDLDLVEYVLRYMFLAIEPKLVNNLLEIGRDPQAVALQTVQIPPDEDLYDSPPDRNRRRRPAESRD